MMRRVRQASLAAFARAQPATGSHAAQDPPAARLRAPLLGRTGRTLAELFPRNECTSRGGSSWRGVVRIAAVAMAVALGAAILLVRQAGDPPWHSMWAEDGRIFLPDALAHPFSSLAKPYAGYLELIPRVIADGVGRLLPRRQAAAGFAVAGAVTAALCAAMAWFACAGHVRRPALRFLLAASVLLLPLAPLEVANTGVNAPWYLLFAAFWALIWRPRSAAGMTVAALASFAAASSTPLVIVFAPLVAARIIALPRLREHAATLGWAVGIALQVPAMLAPAPTRHAGPPTGALGYYGHEVVLAAVAGEHVAQRLQAAAGDTAAVLIAACVLAGFAGWALVTGGVRVRLFTVTALGLSALLVLVAAVTRGFLAHPVWTSLPAWQVGTRYSVVPVLLIDSAAIVAVDWWLRGRAPGGSASRPGARHIAAVLLVAVLGLSWAADFRLVTLRSGNPPPPLSLAAVASLRATPRTMVTRLAAMDRAGTPSRRDRFAFAALGQMLRDYSLPPPLAAEVYRALASVPGVRIRRDAADVTGRRGIGFSDRVTLANGEGRAVETIIVTRSGHRLLAIQYRGYGRRYHGPIQVVILR